MSLHPAAPPHLGAKGQVGDGHIVNEDVELRGAARELAAHRGGYLGRWKRWEMGVELGAHGSVCLIPGVLSRPHRQMHFWFHTWYLQSRIAMPSRTLSR